MTGWRYRWQEGIAGFAQRPAWQPIGCVAAATLLSLGIGSLLLPGRAPLGPEPAHDELRPAPPQLVCDLSALPRIARDHRLSPLLGAPSPGRRAGAIEEVSAPMLASGSFAQLHAFLVALNRDPAALSLGEMNWVPVGPQKLDLHARVFCLRLAVQEENP